MPYTLLLADDSVTIQRVVELTFAGEGISVVAVGDGDAAVARIEAAPPDIVLADIEMPGRTGYQVAQYVARSPRLAHIPVLLLRGAFEPFDERKADEAGYAGVLVKPFEPHLVIARVRGLLGLAAPSPTSPPVGLPAPPVTAARPADLARLDHYFDELDAAFATIAASVPSGSIRQEAPASPADAAVATTALPVEGQAPLDRAAPSRPAAPAGQAAGPAMLPSAEGLPLDDVLEEVTRRVLERLSTSVGRDSVAEVVSAVAERLVREEIERIKSSIK